MQESKQEKIDWSGYEQLSEELERQWREDNLGRMTLEQVYCFYVEVIEPMEQRLGEDVVAEQLEVGQEDLAQMYEDIMIEFETELRRYDSVRESVKQQLEDEETTMKQEEAEIDAESDVEAEDDAMA